MVIAYLRVGTSNKELLEEQKDEIERYASNHDMNVDKWITDVTVDKGREDERNLARVLDRMQKGDSLILSDGLTGLPCSSYDSMPLWYGLTSNCVRSPSPT